MKKPNIVTPAQRKALASPARQEIVDALDAAGPSSVSRIAQLTGRPADGLYFHLRALERCDLVRVRTVAKTGRHLATLYDLSKRPLKLAYTTDPAIRRQNARIVAAAIRVSSRDFADACADASIPADGPRRKLWGGRSKGWLTNAELARAVALISELSDLIRAGTPRNNTTPIALGFLLAPTTRTTSRSRS